MFYQSFIKNILLSIIVFISCGRKDKFYLVQFNNHTRKAIDFASIILKLQQCCLNFNVKITLCFPCCRTVQCLFHYCKTLLFLSHILILHEMLARITNVRAVTLFRLSLFPNNNLRILFLLQMLQQSTTKTVCKATQLGIL